MREGEELFGFRVNQVTKVPDVKGRMWQLTYIKNGAQLVWLDRPDDVKTFVIGFKTLPSDDTGVAHILEHSVLCGSQKYPVKSPFEELRKSSPRVFINAMTDLDRTYYPFSTRNDIDFQNLADVYLDAVFHPLSVINPMAFRQEGWHYEVDPATGKLIYNGIVYNEMKGVFAEPTNTAIQEVMHELYPDTVYGYESGGKPSAIPDLTYEQYCAFHAKYYHPSNARIFLDGSIDIPTTLKKLDSFLRDFDRRSDFEDIPIQAPCSNQRVVEYPSASTENKTILCIGWSAGRYNDLPIHSALKIVINYLCHSNESPLKHALLEKKLCDDVSFYSDDFQQLPLILILRNTSNDKIEACKQTIKETLQAELAKGLDAKRLRAIINRQEFDERELDSIFPRGLIYFGWAIKHWWYGGDPATNFKLSEKYKVLREGVDHGLFERCIRECLLENPHRSEIIMKPVLKSTEVHTAEIKDCSISLQQVQKENQALKDSQEKPDSPEYLAKMPVFKVSDLDPIGPRISSEIFNEGDITFIKTKTTCDGVAYLTFCFPLDQLKQNELLAMPLFARLFSKLDTEQKSAIDLQTELAEKVGRILVSPLAATRGNFLRVEIAFLVDQFKNAVELLKEVLLETQFKDSEAIGKIHRQAVVTAERNAATNGHALAVRVASAKLNRRCATRDTFRGLGQLRWLQSTKVDNTLLELFSELQKKIFIRNKLVLSHTDNLTKEQVEQVIASFPAIENPQDGTSCNAPDIPEKVDFTIGLELSADTGYAGWVAPLPGGYCGSTGVVLRILSLGYLLHQIREVGGAYGTGISISTDDILESFSYRDPTPLHSLEKMSGIATALREFVASEESINKYIVATTALLDPYFSPPDEADRAMSLYLNCQTQEDVDRMRHEILATKKKDLLKVADSLESAISKASTCVVGGASQLQSENGKVNSQPI